MADWNQEYNDAPPIRDFEKPNMFEDGTYDLEIENVRFFQKKDSLTDCAAFDMRVVGGPHNGKLASRIFGFDPGAPKDKMKTILGMYRHFIHTCLNGEDVPPNDLELTEIAERFMGIRLRGVLKTGENGYKNWNNVVKLSDPEMPNDDGAITDADVSAAEDDLDKGPF